MKKVLVLAETREGKLRNVSFEALSAAQKVAEGGEIFAALLGSSDENLASQLGNYGACKVYLVANDQLRQYTADGYTRVLNQLVKDIDPDAIFMGHTAIGKDIGPRSARLGLGLVSDITDLRGGCRGGLVYDRFMREKLFKK